ncbi:MAG: alpha/beta hydrolase [Phycisphaerales bacterium]
MPSRLATFLAALSPLPLLAGCTVPKEELVQPPLVFQLGYAPGTRPDIYDPEIDVYFATTRVPDPEGPGGFGNDIDSVVRLGHATVWIGDEAPWSPADVRTATLDVDRENTPIFELGPVRAGDVMAELGERDWTVVEDSSSCNLANELRAAIAATPDKSLLVFVDGTKGNLYRTCALSAEARHLLGRSMPVLTFAWPSHQNIFQYLFKEDVHRADEAGLPFAAVMDWASEHLGAERINVVSYSAGGRVAGIGLSHLRERHAELEGDALRERLPLRTVVFAAADEPVDRFIKEVPLIHDIADLIVVTISKRDHAVRLSEVLIGEGQRIGRERWNGPSEAEMQMLRELPHVEFVDVSYGREDRGFKIEGHHYWYRQPWVVSDVLMAVRTGLPGDERGLQPEALPRVWALTAEYPDAVRDAADAFLPRQSD